MEYNPDDPPPYRTNGHARYRKAGSQYTGPNYVPAMPEEPQTPPSLNNDQVVLTMPGKRESTSTASTASVHRPEPNGNDKVELLGPSTTEAPRHMNQVHSSAIHGTITMTTDPGFVNPAMEQEQPKELFVLEPADM